MFGMADGSTAYFSSVKGMAGNPSRYGLQIYASHGVIEVLEGVMGQVSCLRDRSWAPLRSGKAWQEVTSAGWDQAEPLTSPEYQQRHTLAIRDLIRGIQEQKEPMGGILEARGSLEMIAAILESHRQGKPVSLPLANRKHPLVMLG
jgi:predicted dehydrogenase